MHKFLMAMSLSLLAVSGLAGCGGEEETQTCEQACQDTGQSAYTMCLGNGGEDSACLQQGEAAYQRCSADCASGGNGGGNTGGPGGSGGGNNGGGNNGGGGAGGGGGMMFDPPGSTLPPEVAQCERGCLQSIACGAASECPYPTSASVISRCRSACADQAQRAAFSPLEMQACPGAGTAALDALGLTGVCVGSDNACVAAMAPCMAGEECVGGGCQPYQCAPDMNEGLGMGAGAAVDLGGDDAAILGMNICSSTDAMGVLVPDEDWYRITVTGGTNAFVELAFEGTVGDVDVKAYLESDLETAIDSAVSGSDNERMLIRPAETDRTILIKVYTFMGAQNNYDLYVTHDVPLATCAASSECDPGYGCVERICTPLPPCMVDDDCGFSAVCEVATGICRQCLDDAGCGEGRFCIDFACVACRDNADCEGGTCLENRCVDCVQDSDCPDGTCSENNQCRAAACDDPYEPNDSEDLAAALPLDQDTQGAYACGDDDFYRFNLPPNTSAYITTTFEHDEGDIDIRVTQGEETVGSSVGREDAEYIGIPAGAGGDYVLRVFKFGGSSQPYTVRLDQNPAFAVCGVDEDCGAGFECDTNIDQCVPEGSCRSNADCDNLAPICDEAAGMCQPCQNDQFEPNDTIEMPMPIAQVPAGAQLNLCGGPDFFEVVLAPGGTVSVQVNFVHEAGDVDVRLFGPDGMMTVESAVSTDDNETLEYVSEAGGKHVLEIYGFRDVFNTYTMSVEIR